MLKLLFDPLRDTIRPVSVRLLPTEPIFFRTACHAQKEITLPGSRSSKAIKLTARISGSQFPPSHRIVGCLQSNDPRALQEIEQRLREIIGAPVPAEELLTAIQALLKRAESEFLLEHIYLESHDSESTLFHVERFHDFEARWSTYCDHEPASDGESDSYESPAWRTRLMADLPKVRRRLENWSRERKSRHISKGQPDERRQSARGGHSSRHGDWCERVRVHRGRGTQSVGYYKLLRTARIHGIEDGKPVCGIFDCSYGQEPAPDGSEQQRPVFPLHQPAKG